MHYLRVVGFHWLVVLLGVALAAGCSSPDETSGDDTGGSTDVSTDVGGDDTDTDDGDDGGPDAGPASCTLQSDCPHGEICHNSECIESIPCARSSAWTTCVDKLNEIEEGLGIRASCDDGFCRLSCIIDQHCRDEELCSDNGHCIPFTGNVTGEHPGGEQRTDLQAGVSNVLMNFPIGLSMGGYGSRAASNDGRYVESLQASHGQMHGLYARAIALDTGDRELLLIRLPIIFPSLPLHEAVARALQEETGHDWRDSLIISGTHTHSGPTRYWQLPTDALAPIGTFGTDEYSEEAFGWLVDTIVESALEARADRGPARLGWEIVEAFDMEDKISSDRWSQTPPFDDNRLLLMRIDDPDGNPKAVLVSFGTHGTVNSSAYMTGDVLAGMERALETALGEHYERFVPVLYFNQNGGSMSPRGDRAGHREAHVYESIGYQFVQVALEPVVNIQTAPEVVMGAKTHRFPVTYELVGYEDGEWSHRSEKTTHGAYQYGALQCLAGQDDNDPATYTPPEEVRCLGLHRLAYHRPMTLLSRSQITALQINDLTIVTLPGEATMEIGWQVLREIRDVYNIDPMRSFIWGYAQDHQLYLTPTNLRGELPPFPGISTPKAPDEYPDFAFSFLQGGYEASSTPWGFKFGDFIVDRSREAMALLLGEDIELELPPAKPTEFTRHEYVPFPIDLTDAARVGTVVLEPPEQVKRLEAVEFGWIGGDPGAEMPQAPLVTLERGDGQGGFAAFKTPSHRWYDNREMLMLTRVRPEDEDRVWLVYWEELKDFPAGQYRFKVEGHYQEEAGASGRKPYTTTSRVFELVPNDAVSVNASTSADQVTGTLAYPAAQRLHFLDSHFDRAAVTGSFRMRHPKVGTGIADPLVAEEDLTSENVVILIKDGEAVLQTLTGADVALTTAPETVDGRDGVPVTRFTANLAALAPGTYQVEIDVIDVHGNHGASTVALEITE